MFYKSARISPFAQPAASSAVMGQWNGHDRGYGGGMQFQPDHCASEGRVRHLVRAIEERCPHVFGYAKQAFPTHIAEEVREMLVVLQRRAEAAGSALGPVKLGLSSAELTVMAETITMEQLDAMYDAFALIEQSLEN